MSISLYRRRIAATVIQLAKDDPSLVKEVIARLRESGEIEADDLVLPGPDRRPLDEDCRGQRQAGRINVSASSARVA